jgi:HEAT repeat protein
MDAATRTHIDNIHSSDKDAQNAAYYAVIEATDKPVDWAYEVWDGMVADLRHKDNHVRAIAAQVLCNLAKSDPENRMLKDFEALLNVTKDERFVTARHCMQALWKVGIVGNPQQEQYMEGLERRYKECVAEKNTTLIRSDIIQSMRNVYDVVKDEAIKAKALALIEIEDDLKYRKKYATFWKK